MQGIHRSCPLNQMCSPQTPQPCKGAKPYNSGITLLCLYLQEEKIHFSLREIIRFKNTESKVIYLISSFFINSLANKGKVSLTQAPLSLLFWGGRIAMNTLPKIAFGSTELGAQLLAGARLLTSALDWSPAISKSPLDLVEGRGWCPARFFHSAPLSKWGVWGVLRLLSRSCSIWALQKLKRNMDSGAGIP